MLDGEGITVDQMATHFYQVGEHRAVSILLGIRLAPADQARVGLDLDEQPTLASTRINQKRRHLSNVHWRSHAGHDWSPPSTRSTWPVMNDAPSPTRNATARATSIGCP